MEEYRERIVKLEQIVKDMASSVCELRSTLFGNGKPGIKYEFIQLKNALKYNNIVTSILTFAVCGNLVKIIFFP